MPQEKVVKIAQEILIDAGQGASITPALIREAVDSVLKMRPSWEAVVDRSSVESELIRRFSVWIGKDATLRNMEGHVDWLDAERKNGWAYWERYRNWQERKLSWAAIEGLDASTDRILELLEDPRREGPWDRRGLVVGHVQSGKTGNYIGLINKAADAGYKIIIVLAGLHNNLRSQTQIRLDEGFLGYETTPNKPGNSIGVGEFLLDPTIRPPNYVTNRTESGDFKSAVANNLGIRPEEAPWLFVVKKNKTILEQLYQWIRNHVAQTTERGTGRKIVTHLPLLVIDDEADQASVDTGLQVFDAEGNPDEEHNPTAINSRIRKILNSFSRSAYVGYTATPFANIFIHDQGTTRDEGPDLFPASFIINLAAPSNYIGPAKVFGKSTSDGRTPGLPLLREVDDTETWLPAKHNKDFRPRIQGEDLLPPSLIHALDAFLLTTTDRKLRGQGNQHSSMLIHVTRFNAVQAKVEEQVSEHFRRLKQRISRGIDQQAVIARLRGTWENDFVPTSNQVASLEQSDASGCIQTWDQIWAALPIVLEDILVKTINGTAKDALDYVANEKTGLKVVAIGGDKLARGLTLEGLSVSYFLRASRMYDTLMQMGRWFGYRPGYLDLCRLYTTPELTEWFGHIADASEELREEFDLMVAVGGTPKDYGLKVVSHPVLMVTSKIKMRNSHKLRLSFSGQLVETVALRNNPTDIQWNFDAGKRLIDSLGEPAEKDPKRERGSKTEKWSGSYLWRGVPADLVVRFLTEYRTHQDAYRVNSTVLASFVSSMAATGELVDWTVVIIGKESAARSKVSDAIEPGLLRRKRNQERSDRYSIGRLMSPRDEAIDLTSDEWIAAMRLTLDTWRTDPSTNPSDSEPTAPSGRAAREIRGFGAPGIIGHPEKGLLFLYHLDPIEAGFEEGSTPILAFAASFPGSDSSVKVDYLVNNILWEQEYALGD
ncbi:MAG TPA: Z1 domain-containing protein [Fibrobacteria bacterium]|nr:Z1 domain-containing protein [Fibrobacteria bacterium]